ncbi:MAG: hypothetical protein JWO30_4092 [Fibrobacteres bacterium]|nr:hypothetical protein [Fibrobacterota bacterium]
MIGRPCSGILGSSFLVKTKALIALTGLSLGLSLSMPRAEDKMNLKPLQSGASLYFGQMFNIDDSSSDFDHFNSSVTLPQTSLWMVQEATINERLEFRLGIAGTFWYPFPEDKTVGYTSYRTGGVAISQASGSYKFGDLAKPWLQISVGQQGYKYNPYAKNFGEYLYRSEAYPTTIRTGDWGAIDNAGAGIWGAVFKTSFMDGLLTNDVLANLANERSPLNDISIGDVFSINVGKVFQVGGGVVLNRLIAIDPAKSKPKLLETGWFEYTAADRAKWDTFLAQKLLTDPNYLETAKLEKIVRLPSGGLDTLPDSGLTVGQTYWANSERPMVHYLVHGNDSDPAAVNAGIFKTNDIEYIEYQATLLMGRFSFDVKPLLGDIADIFGTQDLVLYGEVSVLGTKNYPLYYTAVSQRTPAMIGFNVPAFHLLDFLTFEAEYIDNPHMNSDAVPALNRAPRPKSQLATRPEVPDIADEFYDGSLNEDGQPNHRLYAVNNSADNFKWTVTALKSFGVWNVAFQYGTDHFRPLTSTFHPSYTEAATTHDARYYMLRLMVNL